MQAWHLRYLPSAAFAALLLIVGTGCAREQAPAAPPQALFVVVPQTRSVEIFPVNATGAAHPVATIKEDPPDQPIGVAADLLGEVFIANANGNVKVYRGRNFQFHLLRTLAGPNTQLKNPTAIAVNIAGGLAVTQAGVGAGGGRLQWFTAGISGNVSPERVLAGPHTRIKSPSGVAIDGSGRLFVAERSSNQVLVFNAEDKDDTEPAVTLGGLHAPAGVFVDALLDVFVCNRDDSSITMFGSAGPQNWLPGVAFTSPALRDPRGVAVDAAGRIAVAGKDGVMFFAPNASATADPIARLTGGVVSDPAGLTISNTRSMATP